MNAFLVMLMAWIFDHPAKGDLDGVTPYVGS